MSLEQLAREYAARNAIEHDEAALKPVMGRLLGNHEEHRDHIDEVKQAVEEALEWVKMVDQELLEDIAADKREPPEPNTGLDDLSPIPWKQAKVQCDCGGTVLLSNNHKSDYVWSAQCYECGNNGRFEITKYDDLDDWSWEHVTSHW